MDFTWVSDIPATNRKCFSNNTSNDSQQSLSTSNIDGSHSSYTPPLFDSNSGNNAATARRSRAGTMPSSTLSPFMNLGPSNLYIAQQRPNHNTNKTNSVYSLSGMSSPLDENASSTIVSTLASLGLHDDKDRNNNKKTPLMADSNSNELNYQNYFEPVTRNRAFTVSSSWNTKAGNHRPSSMMSFSPFPQQQQQQQQQQQKISSRPRAISLGMMDSPLRPLHAQQQQSSQFAPFDSSYQQHQTLSDCQKLSCTNSNLTDDDNSNNHVTINGNSNSNSNSSNNSNSSSTSSLYHHSHSNMFTRMDSHQEEQEDYNKYHQQQGSNEEAETIIANNLEPPAQTLSRALWLGSICPSVSVPDLHNMFARYGHIESVRILSDKECAFVNFENVESALVAKQDLVNRLGSKVGGSVVKVGFGNADVDLVKTLTQDAGPNAQGPTRALWVGNIPSDISPATLRSLFQSFGTIESIRILSQKKCGFVNFEEQQAAVRARKHMQNREILGPGTGIVRIGFAKVPINKQGDVIEDVVISGNTISPYATPTTTAPSASSFSSLSSSTFATSSPPPSLETTATKGQTQKDIVNNSDSTAVNPAQWATVLLMARMMMNVQKQQQQQQSQNSTLSSSFINPSPSNSTSSNSARLVSERKMIMQQLGYEPKADDLNEKISINYSTVIPTVLEFTVDRKLGPMRLREIKKALDNDQGIQDIEAIAHECMNEIVELCSDYIGNTVIQKLFEHCCDDTKLLMIEKIAPYLASIGIHKNGTWVAQKIIHTASTDQQIHLICAHITQYVPLLLLDQFGNYVIQCCLLKGPSCNQYIFDAIVDNCWKIGQGRFGSRSVRAILENPIVTRDQQIYVAAAIMQNSLLLTTNANGSILLNWLLDTSGLLGHFRALCNTN